MLKNEKYTDGLNSLMDFIENSISGEYPTVMIGVDHFILAVMSDRDNVINAILSDSLSTFIYNMIKKGFSEQISSKSLSAIKPGRELKIDGEFLDIIEKANEFKNINNSEKIGIEHVFISAIENSTSIKSVFSNAGITSSFIMSKIAGNNISEKKSKSLTDFVLPPIIKNIVCDFGYGDDSVSTTIIGPQENGKKKKQNSAISQFCINLNNLAETGRMDEIVGRENEIDEIIRVLGRRKKNNIILVGNEGVGKTAVAESLAFKIVEGKVPSFLKDKTIVSLDMTALIAGTTLRGMFEERVKSLIDEIKKSGKYILMIDNIGAAMSNKNKNDYDISAMLSTALENGDIQVIGTSDYKSYRSTFDKDPSLSRRFQKLTIEQPSVNDSISILRGIKKYYEEFHNVIYTDDAVTGCVELANKYITERNLPDSAIDLMDEAGSKIGKSFDESDEIKELRNKINNFRKESLKYKKMENYKAADELTSAEKKHTIELIEKLKENGKRKPIVGNDVILDIVSKKTGIPVNSLSTDDKKRLIGMNERLKSEVIGQDEAIDTVCRSLKRNRVGLRKSGCLYSAMLCGKTGVGKTFLAKKLAKEMFGDENSLIRFDMSEYPDKTAVNKLIGSNPGYVGYEEGGQLTESVKNKKHCVLLLDEIEKADKEVYNIFLQVLDEGFLTDNSGMKVDFKNTIVLFTSNIGAKAASDFSAGIGFNEDEDANEKRILSKELKNKFPPEFINRLDNVIYFNKLTDDNLKDIIKLELNKTEKSLEEIKLKLNYDDDLVSYLLNIVKTEKDFGARPIMRAIRNEVEDKVTDLILENDYKNEHTFEVKIVDGKVKID